MGEGQGGPGLGRCRGAAGDRVGCDTGLARVGQGVTLCDAGRAKCGVSVARGTIALRNFTPADRVVGQ